MNVKKNTAMDTLVWPPLARSNPNLVGHINAEKILMDAYHNGRMAHAWMICGPKGVGKATLAYRFARYVLSHGGLKKEPVLCGVNLPLEALKSLYTDPKSPVFQRVAAGGHGDLMSVQRSLNEKGKLRSEIVVDNVREAGGFMSMTASEGGWRIIVIDSADEMNLNAANAVLKILEEPPDRALLLLITHNPGYLLPTIRSRCRKLNLHSLGAEDMGSLLNIYVPDLSDNDALKLAELAEGSIGRAVDLVEAGGLELYRVCLALLSSLPQLDMVKLHTLADQLSKTGSEKQFATILNLLYNILARLLRFKAEGSMQNGHFFDEAAIFDRICPDAGLDRWIEVWEKVCSLMESSKAVNLDRKQVVLNIFIVIYSAFSK